MSKAKLDFKRHAIPVREFRAAQAAEYERGIAQAAARNYLTHTEWLIVAASRGGPAVDPEVVRLRALAEAELKA